MSPNSPCSSGNPGSSSTDETKQTPASSRPPNPHPALDTPQPPDPSNPGQRSGARRFGLPQTDLPQGPTRPSSNQTPVPVLNDIFKQREIEDERQRQQENNPNYHRPYLYQPQVVVKREPSLVAKVWRKGIEKTIGLREEKVTYWNSSTGQQRAFKRPKRKLKNLFVIKPKKDDQDDDDGDGGDKYEEDEE